MMDAQHAREISTKANGDFKVEFIYLPASVWRQLGQIAAGRGAGVHLRRHLAHAAPEELAVAVQPQPILGHPEPHRHRLILHARDDDARARRCVL